MTAPTTTKLCNALLLLFPNYNTLDVNGPFEVLRKSGVSKHFKITVASSTEYTTSIEGATLKRNLGLDAILKDPPALANYDMLIVPRGSFSDVHDISTDINGNFMTLIKRFVELEPHEQSGKPSRTLLSICNGAVFLGALGIFSDMYCTTHWICYTQLNTAMQIAAKSSGKKSGTVIRARFVDAGNNDKDVNIISAGGISCGIDASLHVVKKLYGEQEALETANLLDYAWRKTEGVIFGETFEER